MQALLYRPDLQESAGPGTRNLIGTSSHKVSSIVGVSCWNKCYYNKSGDQERNIGLGGDTANIQTATFGYTARLTSQNVLNFFTGVISNKS